MSEPIVFIPGLACTAELYAPQAPIGEGRSTLVLDHLRDGSIGSIAARFLSGAPERFALVALSMGGYIAFEIMRRAPERVTRLALLDTTARPEIPEATERRLRLIEIARAGRLRDVHALSWERSVHPSRFADAALEEVVFRMLEDTGAEAFERQQRAIIAREDSRPSLAALNVPTLMLVGAEDVITPVEVAREIADAVPGAELVVVPECGHLSTLERPEAVNAALSRFLA